MLKRFSYLCDNSIHLETAYNSINPIVMKKSRKLTPPELTEAIKNNQHIYDEFYDEEFVKAVLYQLFVVIDKAYFRSVLIGFDEWEERNQAEHPLIFASNHSGMAFPWDGMVFGTNLLKKHNFDTDKSMRVLAAPALSANNLMNPYMLPNMWKMAGAVDATFLNFDTMMYQPNGHLLIYPEGVPGIGKGFNNKYQLQRFASSFIKMSIKYRTDIIPFATVNGEYINPYSYSFKWLNKISQKIGIPFLPVGIQVLLIFIQPWAFYLAFPAKLFYIQGKRIKPYEIIDKPVEEMTDEDIYFVRDKVKEEMQKQLDIAVAEYGKKPYHFSELIKAMWKNKKYFPFFLPFSWPYAFTELYAQFEEFKKTGKPMDLKLNFWMFLKLMIKHPFVIFFFIPIIGWIPLLIWGLKSVKKD